MEGIPPPTPLGKCLHQAISSHQPYHPTAEHTTHSQGLDVHNPTVLSLGAHRAAGVATTLQLHLPPALPSVLYKHVTQVHISATPSRTPLVPRADGHSSALYFVHICSHHRMTSWGAAVASQHHVCPQTVTSHRWKS